MIPREGYSSQIRDQSIPQNRPDGFVLPKMSARREPRCFALLAPSSVRAPPPYSQPCLLPCSPCTAGDGSGDAVLRRVGSSVGRRLRRRRQRGAQRRRIRWWVSAPSVAVVCGHRRTPPPARLSPGRSSSAREAIVTQLRGE